MARSASHEFVKDKLVAKSALSEEDRAEAFAVASSALAEFDGEIVRLMAELRSMLSELDPIVTTAHISCNHIVTPWGDGYEPTGEGSEAAVEIVGSIFASQPSESTRQPASADIQAIEDTLVAIADVQMLRGLAAAMADSEPSGFLRSMSRLHWSTVRGDAYQQHGRDLAVAIFGPVENWIRDEFGFSIEEFFTVGEAVISIGEDRINAAGDQFAGALNKFYPRTDLSEDESTQLSDAFHAFFFQRPTGLVVTVDDVASVVDVGAGTVAAVLGRLSVGVGELTPADYKSPFDPPPFFVRPFLRRGDEFVLPVPGHIVRSPHDLFEARLLARFPRFSKHRADVVDRTAIELLVSALPGATYGSNLHYRFDDGEGLQEFETDGVILFENYCIVVEGKAVRLSTASRRGDLVRLQRDLKRSLEEGWQQCARVQRFLGSGPVAQFTDARGRDQLRVECDPKRRVLFINPMLHSMGLYAHELPTLRALGLFSEAAQPWPVLVTDLRVIVEMTRTPAELLHFIEWRQSLPIGDTMTVVDELDLFGMYLFGGLDDMTQLSQSPARLQVGSCTTDFDAYYAGESGHGPQIEKPRRVLGDWLPDVLEDLATRRPPGWLTTSMAILDLPLGEAAAITTFAQDLARMRLRQSNWTAETFGDTTIVALRRGIKPEHLVLELAQNLPASPRRFMISIDNSRPRLLFASSTSR